MVVKPLGARRRALLMAHDENVAQVLSWEPHADFVNVTIGGGDRLVRDFGAARHPLALAGGVVTIPTEVEMVSGVLGDADGSGTLDMADVDFMQRLIVNGGDLSALSAWQLQALDPTLDYMRSGYDCNTLPGCSLDCPDTSTPCPTSRDAMAGRCKLTL